MPSTPTVDKFLSEIALLLRARDGAKLQDFLVIEPPYGNLYMAMVNELKRTFPKGREHALETACRNALPEARGGDDEDAPSWSAFVKFMVAYFAFLRDVNIENLLETYNLLSEVVQKCNSALSHPTMGVLILPTVVVYSRLLARLAIGLDKQPQLIAHLTKQQAGDEGGARETLPERAANIVRLGFVTCLNDRSSGVKDGKPEGKKLGIYKMANLCLKILFQCGKPRNAEQIFVNIDNQSPPLSGYPRAEQVMYLYYLGRFLFANNHFYRALLALQEAFRLSHNHCIKQRRLILIHLIASNIILGRFPSQSLYQRPEAAGLLERFHPICTAISKGDLASFKKFLGPDGPHAGWFLNFKILLQLRHRAEVLVWRSLARKTFVISGVQGDGRKAPLFRLDDLLHLARFLERRALAPANPKSGVPGRRHTNWVLMQEAPPESYCDPDFDALQDKGSRMLLPDMLEIESILSSLLDQGLLNGYISHRLQRFAIQGAKKKGSALAAGFPNIWETIKEAQNEQVPGWKRSDQFTSGTGPRSIGPGMVVNLSGARSVGSAA